MNSPFFLIFPAFLALIITFRITAHFLDKDRVRSAAACKGWSNINVQWEPFALGSIFENKERFYSVSFVDREGISRRLQCKTSMLTGVSWLDRDFTGF